MNRRLQIFLVVFLVSFFAKAQNQAANWYFGSQAGISFNTSPPSLLNNGNLFSTEGASSISAADGSLLFYTNGQTIWDKTHKIMANGSALLGSSNTTQSSIIVPKPKSKNIYYVFTLDALGGLNGLHYSEVDITANSGLGRVTSNKNKALLSNSLSEKLTAIRHGNGIDYWVLVHGNNDNKFYAFKITASGVSTVAETSTIGSIHPFVQGTIGYMKFSPDGKKVACAVGGSGNFVEIFDFNDLTGELSNTMKLSFISSPYGIEFSPNSKLLYVSANTSIYQYTLPKVTNSTLLSLSEVEIKSDAQVWGLQLGLDKKIYVCKQANKLSVINLPNKNGGSENFIDNVFSLNNTAIQGLPNLPQHYFNQSLITIENACAGQKATFKVLLNEPDSIVWNFGNSKINALTPQYIFNNSGTYAITAKVYTGSYFKVLTKTITIEDLPKFTLGADTVLCKGQYLDFNFPNTESNFLWNNGSTNHLRKITTPGVHYLDITTKGCTIRDSVVVDYRFVNPSFSINKPEQCIKTNAFEFTSTTDGIKKINWYIDDVDFDEAKTTQTSFTQKGNYKITLKVVSNSGCIDSISKEVIVNANPVANFSVKANNTCGKNNSFTFSNTTGYSGTNTFDFIIEGKKTSNTPTLNWTFSKAGEHIVRLVVKTTEGCDDIIEKKIVVYPAPDADFTITATSNCLADNSFNINFNGTVRNYETLSWEVDGTPFVPGGLAFSKSFNTIGKHTISSKISNTTGCVETITKTIEVYKNPIADFTTVSNSLSCLGQNDIKFTNLSSSTLPLTEHLWSFGDNTNSTSVNPIKTYTSQSQFNVTLKTTNEVGCASVITKIINTYEQPKIAIQTKTNSSCEDDNSFELSYNNSNSLAVISKVIWQSSGGNTIPPQSPAPVSFSSSGSFTIDLQVETMYGCKASASSIVKVNPQPSGVILIDNNSQCLNSNLFAAEAPTSHNGIAISNFVWDLSTTNSSSTTNSKVTFSYDKVGDYTINTKLTDENGCEATLTKTVSVNPIPKFNIVAASGCVNIPITMAINGLSPFIVVNNWNWGLGNSEQSSSLSPVGRYKNAGSYTVKATATSNKGCSHTSILDKGIEIHPNPQASFEHKRVSWNFEETIIEFEASSSINTDNFTWDFGNGQTSTTNYQRVDYTDAGYYKVSLIAETNKGCKGTISKTILIVPPFDAYVPTSFTPNGDGINDSFGMEGVEFINTFEMAIFNRWGQEIFHSNDLKKQWDGRYNNAPMSGGMYSFKITITDAEGRPYDINGTIQLIR